MLHCCEENVHSLLSGCLACLFLISVVNADGRVFVLDPRSLSGVQGFRDAHQACYSQRARLASADELRHAVSECFFSHCAHGWLNGGMVGTTVCNTEGSSLKTVSVRVENVTADTTHLSAFCIKDKAVACGDPPSFPNARLQEHSGFEMGDELMYTCVPGYVMPSGHAAFSLLCDSCGEWYGTVQICVRDKTEGHVDYEDKFQDSYRQTDRDRDSSEEARDKAYEVSEGASQDKTSLQQQETRFMIKVEEAHQDRHKERDMGGTVINNRRAFGGEVDKVAKNEDKTLMVHPRLEQEVVRTDPAAATEEPVSLLSQKHLFWFPSEAFQEEGPLFSTDSVTQTTQRASGAQSQESKENESQEQRHVSLPLDADDHDDEQDRYDDLDRDDGADHDDSRHDDGEDVHEDKHTDDPDDADSRQEEDDDVKHRDLPDDLDTRDSREDHDDHDDHYDMGENEDDLHRVRYGSQDHDDRGDPDDEHHSHEDHDDAVDDHKDKGGEDPDVSEEHPERDHHDNDDDDDDDHDLLDHDIHTDRKDKYDDRDSHEDDDGLLHVMFPAATERRPNITQRRAGSKTAKDDTWLDGYPVQETENGDSTRKQIRPVDGERIAKTTEKPNDVEVRRRVPHTISPVNHGSPTPAPELDQGALKKVKPGFRTPDTFPDHLLASDSPSYSDTLDYDTQQAAPTRSWLDELTEHPFLDHGPAPPMKDRDIFTGIMGEHTVDNLPGEMGEVEGEMGETICVGEDCPPHPPNSSSRGPTVAAIIVLVCAVAMAAIFGVWCYRRQQQKCSVYEMNEKNQSQTRQGQQMEMQQKV